MGGELTAVPAATIAATLSASTRVTDPTAGCSSEDDSARHEHDSDQRQPSLVDAAAEQGKDPTREPEREHYCDDGHNLLVPGTRLIRHCRSGPAGTGGRGELSLLAVAVFEGVKYPGGR